MNHFAEEIEFRDGLWHVSCDVKSCGEVFSAELQRNAIRAWTKHADEMAVSALWDEELVNP